MTQQMYNFLLKMLRIYSSNASHNSFFSLNVALILCCILKNNTCFSLSCTSFKIKKCTKRPKLIQNIINNTVFGGSGYSLNTIIIQRRLHRNRVGTILMIVDLNRVSDSHEIEGKSWKCNSQCFIRVIKLVLLWFNKLLNHNQS